MTGEPITAPVTFSSTPREKPSQTVITQSSPAASPAPVDVAAKRARLIKDLADHAFVVHFLDDKAEVLRGDSVIDGLTLDQVLIDDGYSVRLQPDGPPCRPCAQFEDYAWFILPTPFGRRAEFFSGNLAAEAKTGTEMTEAEAAGLKFCPDEPAARRSPMGYGSHIGHVRADRGS